MGGFWGFGGSMFALIGLCEGSEERLWVGLELACEWFLGLGSLS